MNQSFPLLPLRDIVVFPHMIVPLFVGRDRSVAALEAAMEADKEIFLVAQLDPGEDDPVRDDLYDTGVIATVLQLLKLPDGTVRVLVEGKQRAKLQSLDDDGKAVMATVEPIADAVDDSVDTAALMRSVVDQFESYAKLNKKMPAETAVQLSQIDDSSRLADSVAGNLNIKVADKQALLVENAPAKRLEMVFAFMEGELGVLQVEKKIRGRVKRQMEKSQREYYLNEQLKAIQRELGNDNGEGGDDLAELQAKIDSLKMSKEAKAKANAELKKLRAMAPMSAEATVVRNYLDTLIGLPWGKKSKLKKDIAKAQDVLDADHFALEKVKDRIVEYLAVQARTNKLKGPILCLVGPPGVGKTSLGRSIAKATGREFVRQSLGGVRDEAEIRGHRRTYIGSLPGKIVTNLKKAGTMNPLFLLDEIDKLGQDFRGDPASALLEVLDPEQNAKFQDHYLEVDVDLSDIMFVTTANSLNLPQPLLDRMEIIRLEGYTGSGGRGYRPCLDRSRRRTVDDRSRHCGGQGASTHHRQAGRGYDRVGAGRAVLRQGAGARLWHQAQPVRAQGHPHPPARRRGAQGRALGRRRHGHGDGVDADRHRGAQGCCDDRRGYAAWPRAGDRRPQGKAACGSAGRHHDRFHSRRE